MGKQPVDNVLRCCETRYFNSLAVILDTSSVVFKEIRTWFLFFSSFNLYQRISIQNKISTCIDIWLLLRNMIQARNVNRRPMYTQLPVGEAVLITDSHRVRCWDSSLAPFFRMLPSSGGPTNLVKGTSSYLSKTNSKYPHQKITVHVKWFVY
jgi:hypothetical protein